MRPLQADPRNSVTTPAAEKTHASRAPEQEPVQETIAPGDAPATSTASAGHDLPAPALDDLLPPTLSAQAQSVQKASLHAPQRVVRAIAADDPAQLRGALAHTALLNQCLENGATPLQLAAHLGKAKAAAYLLEQADIEPNIQALSGSTPLLEAAIEGHAGIARMLLAHPKFDIGLESLSMACYLAIEGGHLDMAGLLLGHGADLNQRMDGSTALQTACEKGDVDTVRWLLVQSDIDVFQPGLHGHNLLHRAAMNTAHPAMVMALRERLPPATFHAFANGRDAWGAAPASLAAERGQHADIVALLRPMEIAPTIDMPPTTFQRGWAIVGDRHREWEDRNLVDICEDSGIELKTHGDGKTALTWQGLAALDVQPGDFVACAFHSFWDAALQRVMVELGPDEYAPLVDVARLFHDKGVTRLLFLGCEVAKVVDPMQRRFQRDPDMPRPADRTQGYRGMNITMVGGEGATLTSLNMDAMGFWLKDCVHANQTGAVGRELQRLSVQPMATIVWDTAQQALAVERRAALEADEPGDLSEEEAQEVRIDLLLMHASENQSKKVEHLLDAHDVDPNAQNGAGDTALRLASEAGHPDVVELLLERHADVDLQNMHGFHPLYSASAEGHADVVELLLKAGADPDLKDGSGLSPLDVATARGHGAAVALLQQWQVKASV